MSDVNTRYVVNAVKVKDLNKTYDIEDADAQDKLDNVYTKEETLDLIEVNEYDLDYMFDNAYNQQTLDGKFENTTFVVENASVENTTLIV